MLQTQATVENPIRCWMVPQREWVDVTWTPPGEKWPKERIEKTRLPSYMLKHYDNPDEDLKFNFRYFLELSFNLYLTGRSPVETQDARICYLSAWLANHDPHSDDA